MPVTRLVVVGGGEEEGRRGGGPRQGGKRHVNSRPNDWVIEQPRVRKFTYDQDVSEIRRNSTFHNTLKVFRRKEIKEEQ